MALVPFSSRYSTTPASNNSYDLDFPLFIPFNICMPDESFFDVKKLHSHHYTAHLLSKTVLQFSCLRNFHHVSGDMEMTCLPNGTWNGTEPKCEVDFLMDKLSLSIIIGTCSFILPILWLGLDFYFWLRKRRYVRKFSQLPLSELNRLKYNYASFNPKPARVLMCHHLLEGTSVDPYSAELSTKQAKYISALEREIVDVEEYFPFLRSDRKKDEPKCESRRSGRIQHLFTISGALGGGLFRNPTFKP